MNGGENWKTHVMSGSLLALLLLTNLMRGSSKNPSIINIQKCGGLDWFLFSSFIMMCVAVCYLQVRRVQNNERLKEITNIGTHKSDIKYHGNSLVILLLAGVGGGFAGAVGLGGAVVFGPILLSLGVAPQTSASTGMYMIMYSAFANTLTFWLFGSLNTGYALWIGIWSGLGIYFFLSVVAAMIKKYNRPSIVVFCLAGVIGVSALVVPAVNTRALMATTAKGGNIWGFGQLC